MRPIFLVLSLISILAFSACSSMQPAEDQWDLDEKDDRVNLFGTKEEKGLLEKSFSAGKVSGRSYGATSSDINMPAIDQQSFEDFENFKAWRRAQDPDSPNYQEYQDWRAYQQYLRFKQQQGEPSLKP